MAKVCIRSLVANSKKRSKSGNFCSKSGEKRPTLVRAVDVYGRRKAMLHFPLKARKFCYFSGKGDSWLSKGGVSEQKVVKSSKKHEKRHFSSLFGQNGEKA